MIKFLPAVEFVLEHEGRTGKVVHDHDGVTKFGLCSKANPDLLKLYGDNLERLTLDCAKQEYFNRYWQPMRYERFASQLIVNKVFDMQVNMGAVRAIQLLQRAINGIGVKKLAVDGKLGLFTITAANMANDNILLAGIRSEMAAFYKRLAEARPEEAPNLHGWLNRANA